MTAIAIVFVYSALDILIIAAFVDADRYDWLMVLVNIPTKALAGYFGGKVAADAGRR